ncbi:hypothetical protein BJX63DRAFT_419738 [Aspergillus granulosus]|uniref:Glycoside hydrolase 131 catalytic N-terminal domain-containing protein n=1 Tax=Aspergillus granulosus TaxID=176169 RepID=A0ABR4HNZ0_9EURO
MKSSPIPVLLSVAGLPLASAGTTLWSGLFNETYTVEDFDNWSWANQIPPWQWYIHGSSDTPTYLGVSADFKNPNSTLTDEAQGVRITIDDTSSWNGQTMMRSELIPQISSGVDLGSGVRYYHFSLSVGEDNFPGAQFEHQIAFFESHFTELKYGGSSSDASSLSWYAGGASHWSTPLEAGIWYNFAYGIDFDASTVSLYASTGGDPLELVVEPVSASTSTNSADWHVGQLRLDQSNPGTGGAEDWYWSGIYVEDGEGGVTVDI